MMSSKLQQKLLSIEIPPPAGVWDKIAVELDDARYDHQYSSRLQDITVTPPSGVWDKIAASLDQDISANTLSEKLLRHEEAPPAGTWQKIAASLDATHEATTPEKRTFAPWLRYAAAAAVIVLLTWGGVSLLNKNKTDENVAVNTPSHESQPAEKSVPSAENTIGDTQNDVQPEDAAIAGTANDEARNDAALEASKKTYAKLDISSSSKIKQAADFYFGSPAGTTRGFTVTDNYSPIPVHTRDADRYIVLMTPEGNIIRMSKKLSSMVCCVSGEEQDKECKEQISKWREKIACSPAGHSPGNFMDILSLLNTLQEGDNF